MAKRLHTDQSAFPAPIVLCIAGFDPSGGAGLQADIETVSALGARAICAVTANTVQDGGGREDAALTVVATEPDLLARQLDMLLARFPVAAIKIGLLPTPDAALVARDALREINCDAVVIDPIYRAGNGAALSAPDTLPCIRREILPLSAVATPNRDEALALAPEANDPLSAARALVDEGCRNVLVTSADFDEKTQTLTHLLVSKTEASSIPCAKLARQFHGSGCTLSAAIAAGLAQGLNVFDAIRRAQEFTQSALQRAEKPNSARDAQHFPNRRPRLGA